MSVTTLSPAQTAARFINQTSRNIFLTGKAGTGKTTFLRNIVQHTHKVAVIVAPTGIAAINAGGVTIHSFFQLPFGSYVPAPGTQHFSHLKITDPDTLIKGIRLSDRKRSLYRELELLIIDEVSMLRADMLDAIDRILRHVRKKYNTPFGGVQVLFIGDLLQLPPVVKEEEWKVLGNYYEGMFFFNAHALKNNPPVYIELDKIHRQDDTQFISLLNNLRNSKITDKDAELLNTHYQPGFKALPGENYITLTTHNYKAQNINNDFLARLKEKSFYFEAEIKGEFNEHIYPIEKTLELKKGAQVMFVKNDPSGEKKFFNGKIGMISSIRQDQIEVTFENEDYPVTVEKYEWQNLRYDLDEKTNEIEENIIGTFLQYPLKLAWAITVHKSQGLTFDKAIIDPADAFAPGQVYVALSRLRSLKGLVLTSRVNTDSLHLDASVSNYSQTRETQEDPGRIIERESGLYLHSVLVQCFDFSLLEFKIRALMKDEDDKPKKKLTKINEWYESVTSLIPHANKFTIQLNQYFSQKPDGYLHTLAERIRSAEKYFIKELNSVAGGIRAEISRNLEEKKVKSYLKELTDLENTFFSHIKKIKKACLYIDAVINEKELNRDEIKKYTADPERNSAPVFKKDKKRKSAGQKKADQIPTVEMTLILHKEGLSIEEISAARKLAVGTIEGHLARLAREGKVDVNNFIEVGKRNKILAVADALQTEQFSNIKNALGDEFSYSDIRFAIAYKQYQEGEEDKKE